MDPAGKIARMTAHSAITNSPRYSGIDGFLIRGFPVFASDFAFDGLFGITDTRRPALEPIERVEILKGASALLGLRSNSGRHVHPG